MPGCLLSAGKHYRGCHSHCLSSSIMNHSFHIIQRSAVYQNTQMKLQLWTRGWNQRGGKLLCGVARFFRDGWSEKSGTQMIPWNLIWSVTLKPFLRMGSQKERTSSQCICSYLYGWCHQKILLFRAAGL